MKLDLLVIAVHPDDAELNCGGTVAAQVAAGRRVGFVDLTRGELGTRGTAEIRDREAAEAARLLGLQMRENLCFADGFFRNDETHQLAVVQAIRRYQPDMVITNATEDRHPDHGRAAQLVTEACFLAGLRKVETLDQGRRQEPFRPRLLFHFIQDRLLRPDVVVDITPHWAAKLAAIRAYRSQFYNPDSREPETYISSPDFLDFIESRARELGHAIGVKYGEGYTTRRQVGVRDLVSLL